MVVFPAKVCVKKSSLAYFIRQALLEYNDPDTVPAKKVARKALALYRQAGHGGHINADNVSNVRSTLRATYGAVTHQVLKVANGLIPPPNSPTAGNGTLAGIKRGDDMEPRPTSSTPTVATAGPILSEAARALIFTPEDDFGSVTWGDLKKGKQFAESVGGTDTALRVLHALKVFESN